MAAHLPFRRAPFPERQPARSQQEAPTKGRYSASKPATEQGPLSAGGSPEPADEVTRLKPGCLIIDVSCDEGMGFPFAGPTPFKNPMFKVGPIDDYAVDHTPGYLWESASREIFTVLLRYLPLNMGNAEIWKYDETVRRAIEIRDGVVQNPRILSFRRRAFEYPHRATSKA